MDRSLSRLIEAFADLTVLVTGEAMLDVYLEGSAGRLCREGPVPVVDIDRRLDVPGGAANTAGNVAALGGRAVLVSAVGADAEGDILRRTLPASGVDPGHLLVPAGYRTLVKQRVTAGAQLVVRFDHGTKERVDHETEKRLVDRLVALFEICDAVIVSDYGYGIVTRRVIEALAKLQREAPRVVVVDANELRPYREVGVTAVKPNYEEALRLLRAPQGRNGEDRAARIAAQGVRILDATRAEIAAVTLDREGAIVIESGRPPYRTYARPTRDSSAVGAGDTFAAALALALAAGADTPSAAELASAAAGIAVASRYTAICPASALAEQVAAGEKRTELEDLLSVRRRYRELGRQVVFTNGCFDILHRGHVTYLSQAKELGDLLVVGVNTDESVRRLKGPERPINRLDDRVELLAALSCVDAIVPFDGETPEHLLRALRPDVYVKGGDYTEQTLPEAGLVRELGGDVRILPYVEDSSTTGVIERIRTLALGAAR